jgi:hypothetical protein
VSLQKKNARVKLPTPTKFPPNMEKIASLFAMVSRRNLDQLARATAIGVANVKSPPRDRYRYPLKSLDSFAREREVSNHQYMKRVQAKIEENRKEDPLSEPDKDPNSWLIEAKLDEDVADWETVRLDFRSDEVKAEIVESSMSEPTRFTIRTHGESPLKKGDVIQVNIREQREI